MIKLKIGTRIFNEEYLIHDFINHYLKLGADEIHFYDSSSTDKTLEIIKEISRNNERIIIVESDSNLKHTSYYVQTQICNKILKHAISNCSEEKESVTWIFPDVDEFLKVDNEYDFKTLISTSSEDILRTIFLEWYLPPRLSKTMVNPEMMLDLIESQELKGRILDLWGDPFYKDYIIRLNQRNIKKFAKIQTVAGFHRFILNKRLLIPPNHNYIVVNHLRGVPFKIMKQRTEKNIKILDDKDEWSYEHFSVIKNYLKNYASFYKNNLLTHKEIQKKLSLILPYDNDNSYFNNVIMKDNLQKLGYSKPSMH
ncbi:MAG: glycosyltransferase [Promethearchaeota archaeon]|nr:MAG: glycosyltransferase [Candidatus Lokiarchaeota archaeon]